MFFALLSFFLHLFLPLSLPSNLPLPEVTAKENPRVKVENPLLLLSSLCNFGEAERRKTFADLQDVNASEKQIQVQKSKIVHMLLGRFLCLFTWLFVPIYPGYKNAFLALFYFLPFLGPRLRATGIPRRGEGEGPPFHPLSLEFFPGVSFFAWGALPPSSQLLRALLLSKGAPKRGLLSFFPRTMKSLWQKLLDEWMEKGKESFFLLLCFGSDSPNQTLANQTHQLGLFCLNPLCCFRFP